jgi:hypothetical protein
MKMRITTKGAMKIIPFVLLALLVVFLGIKVFVPKKEGFRAKTPARTTAASPATAAATTATRAATARG